jgi:hypothetical protein
VNRRDHRGAYLLRILDTIKSEAKAEERISNIVSYIKSIQQNINDCQGASPQAVAQPSGFQSSIMCSVA